MEMGTRVPRLRRRHQTMPVTSLGEELTLAEEGTTEAVEIPTRTDGRFTRSTPILPSVRSGRCQGGHAWTGQNWTRTLIHVLRGAT
jgi:hypothetical protein